MWNHAWNFFWLLPLLQLFPVFTENDLICKLCSFKAILLIIFALCSPRAIMETEDDIAPIKWLMLQCCFESTDLEIYVFLKKHPTNTEKWSKFLLMSSEASKLVRVLDFFRGRKTLWDTFICQNKCRFAENRCLNKTAFFQGTWEERKIGPH